MILEGPADTVRVEVANGVGLLTLDRPKALNALDLTMVRAVRDALESWRDDDSVAVVLIESSSAKAFCAGADVRTVRAAILGGEADSVDAFFTEEYALNQCIADYPKPYVALLDGICLGGGMGLSIHGSHRIVTERARLGMPETAIGFFPDIGASYFLPRLPGRLGTFLGLTGSQLSGTDAAYSGLATHFVSAAALPRLRSALLGGADPDALLTLLTRVAQPRPAGLLESHRDEIDACFDIDELPEILVRIIELDSWAAEAQSALVAASRLSLGVTDELLRTAAGRDLADCLDRELALARHLVRGADFAEGVRARLVDKDGHPSWLAGGELADELHRARQILGSVPSS